MKIINEEFKLINLLLLEEEDVYLFINSFIA